MQKGQLHNIFVVQVTLVHLQSREASASACYVAANGGVAPHTAANSCGSQNKAKTGTSQHSQCCMMGAQYCAVESHVGA